MRVRLEIISVTEKDMSRTFSLEGGHLRVALEPPAADGETRTLTIQYRGRPSNAFRRFDDHALYGVPDLAVDACNFDPGDKARFELSLAVPDGWTVLAQRQPI